MSKLKTLFIITLMSVAPTLYANELHCSKPRYQAFDNHLTNGMISEEIVRTCTFKGTSLPLAYRAYLKNNHEDFSRAPERLPLKDYTDIYSEEGEFTVRWHSKKRVFIKQSRANDKVFSETSFVVQGKTIVITETYLNAIRP